MDNETNMNRFLQRGYGMFPYIVMRFRGGIYKQIPIYRESIEDMRLEGLQVWLDWELRFPSYKKTCQRQAELFLVGYAEGGPFLDICMVFNSSEGYYINRKGETKTRKTIPSGGKLYTMSNELIQEGGKHYVLEY